MPKGVIIGVGWLGRMFMEDLSQDYELNLVDLRNIPEPKGTMFVLDVTDSATEAESLLEQAIEGAYFLLYTPMVNPCLWKRSLEEYLEKAQAVHIQAARRVYETAINQGVGKLINTSTFSVYANPSYNTIPNLTEYVEPNPDDFAYAKTKLEGEKVLEQISTPKSKGIVLRLIAPLPKKDFLKAPKSDYNSTHVDDIVHAVRRAIEAESPHRFRIYHIAQPHPKSNISIERARREIKYNPKYSTYNRNLIQCD